MTPYLPAGPVRSYTISVHTFRGRVLVHIDKAALIKMGALECDQRDLLRTLQRHMPRIRALALQLAARESGNEIIIKVDDIWWAAVRGSDDPTPSFRHA
jgi:hypothetical protein